MSDNHWKSFVATLIATTALLIPVHVFADNDIGARAQMFSILDIDQVAGMQRSEVTDADGNEINWAFTPDTSQVLLYTQDIFFPDDLVVIAPILDPDGDHVNLGDWMTAHGSVTATCVPGGTRYAFRFRKMIPNAVYTIWHFPDTGGGALATTSAEQIDNVFMTSKSGRANFSVVAEPGPMTFGGVMPACSVTQSNQELFIVLYHIDSQYCGPFPCNTPGSPAVEVAQLLFKR